MEYVYQQRITLHLALYGGLVGLVLDVGILLFVLERNTASYAVALIDIPGLVVVTLVAAFTLRKCTSYT